VSGVRRLAAIDLGTNSIRLLAVEEEEGEVRTLEDRGEVTRLGAALTRTEEIDTEDAERSLGLLSSLVDQARSLGVTRLDIAGTEVLRRARNGTDVAAWFSRELGHAIQILTPSEEAEASYLGVVGWGGIEEPGLLRVIDIGGGSSEVVLGDGVALLDVRSVPLGALTVTERWLPGDPPDAAAVREAVEEVQSLLTQVLGRVPGEGVRTIAVGGSATAVAAWIHRIRPYDPAAVQGSILTVADLSSAIDEWQTRSIRERMEIGRMSEGRARVILGGGLVIRELLRLLGITELNVSVFGLRHGLILKRLLA
jgi:exopolyphosphatase/guanosine-5'-triphosphate,3'-diphosphate pyrophosphatase